MRTPLAIQQLSSLFGSRGAQVLLIGGGVIDTIAGREVKDWDLEVYGLNLEQIDEILKENGYISDMVGKSFGIIKTIADGLDVDLSVPRRENKTGKGHKGFEVELDPNMTPEEAGRRRDLTINSMYLNADTGEIVDPFNGLSDLQQGIIRATDPNTFVEDPLRVLRIMQLLPRKGKVVHPETIELCRSIHSEFSELPAERIFEEFNKLLLKASKPSVGLEFLRESGWVSHFPELEALIECPQNPEWHPEGDVWNHTLGVVDMAAQLRDEIPKEWQLAYMYGCLLHDIGKPSTTLPDLTSPGHAEAGKAGTETFMARITNEKTLIKNVVLVVTCHMRPGQLHRDEAGISAWKRLHNTIRLDVIGRVSKADSLSRYYDTPTMPHEPSEQADEYFSQFGAEVIPAVLLGRHLIQAGLKPGKEFGVLLRQAYEIQIEEGIEDSSLLLSRVLS